ncbi:MAG: hypothetical protein FWC32_10430 [Firmicutes bacterium]|nr:hypothetical protein [Bacillota bacterium]
MVISFSNLLREISKREESNECYYNIVELSNKLEKSGVSDISIDDDCLISPFYICAEGRTYEMYWLDFSIRHVDKSNMDAILLERARGAVGEEIVKMLYVEIIPPNATFPSAKLRDYANFIAHSDEVKEDVISAFKRYSEHFEFDKNNLFFAVY